MSRIVVAVSGNELQGSPQEQVKKSLEVARSVAPLVKEGHQVVLCPGNGPQVGMLSLVFEKGQEAGYSPLMPLPECTAMTQGYMGFYLQNAMDQALDEIGAKKGPTIAMLMQIIVDPADPEFSSPSRHVGEFYSEKRARELMKETGDLYAPDRGRGWRRLVPSPVPVDICEKKTLARLLLHNQVVVTGSGGGIPVVATKDGYKGVPAVVDKDYAAQKVAEAVGANCLMVLTNVDRVCLDYGAPGERPLDVMTPREAQQWIREDKFAAHGMRRKVDACSKFVSSAPDREAVIGPIHRVLDAYAGRTGTRIRQS